MKNFDIFIWASDFENFTGEGLLARSFIKHLFINDKIKIHSNYGEFFVKSKKYLIIKKKKINNNFFSKYLLIYYGIFLIWYYHLKGKKTVYLNYLPLWNFFIFILLPKKTILGPITGGVHYNTNLFFSRLIRKSIFPFLYRASLKILFYKYKHFFFSTAMLKKYIPKKNLHRCTFNLALLTYVKNNIRKIHKKFDFLFYYKIHPNKSNIFLTSIIDLLLLKKYKICIVGDFLKKKGVINLGILDREKLLAYLKKSKFAINNGENFLSLFALDCYASSTFVFYNNLLDPNKDLFNLNYFISLDFSNTKIAYKKINYVFKCKKNFNQFDQIKIIKKYNQIKKIAQDNLHYLSV
jgi:hypothetical protein